MEKIPEKEYFCINKAGGLSGIVPLLLEHIEQLLEVDQKQNAFGGYL